MKRLIGALSVFFLVFGLATAAMAAFQVEVNTNSEPVTGAVGACEKAGNITFSFDAGTVIQDGDWITADLPIGVTLCNSFDFIIVGNLAGGGGVIFPGAAGFVATPCPNGGIVDYDVWSLEDEGVDGLAGGLAWAGTPMSFRIRGTAGSSRLRIDVYDSDDVVNGITGATNYDGSSTLTVLPETAFQINLFDSEPHDGTGPIGLVMAYNDTDSPKDGFFGDDVANDLLQAINDSDNTYCITVDTSVYLGATVNASINSGGVSGSNFLNFDPSNPQVAHLALAAAIELEACKGDLCGYVPFEGGQGGICEFEYEDGSALIPPDGGYCAPWEGNSVIIQIQSGTFYNPGDMYRMVLTISGNGAYFATSPAGIIGFLPNQDPCTAVGALIGPLWTQTTETGAPFTAYASGAGCGAIAVGSQVTTLRSNPFTGIDLMNALVVDVPTVVYDPAQFTAGDQVTLTVQLQRLPCGLIFTGTRCLAEFIDTCAAAVPNTTLYYPYAVALDGSQGWWYGMTIGNPTAVAGDAVITVAEMDGDIGTATVTVGALGLVVMGGADILAVLTPDAANTGTLGDSPCHIIANCGFGSAGGFGMQGDGVDSTGYLANGVAGAVVAPWAY